MRSSFIAYFCSVIRHDWTLIRKVRFVSCEIGRVGSPDNFQLDYMTALRARINNVFVTGGFFQPFSHPRIIWSVLCWGLTRLLINPRCALHRVSRITVEISMNTKVKQTIQAQTLYVHGIVSFFLSLLLELPNKMDIRM